MTEMDFDQRTTITESEIEYLLQHMCKKNLEALIKIPNGDSHPIFARFVHLQDQSLFLDIFRPPEAGKELRNKKDLIISFAYKGAMYMFSTAPTESQGTFGRDFFVKKPDKIYRVQRREHFRVAPSLALPIHVLRLQGHSADETINVHDISQKGIGLVFKHKPPFAAGQKMPDNTIILPKNQTIRFNATVREMFIRKDGKCLVGLEFDALYPGYEEAIRQYAYDRQREHLRSKRYD
jgi:c-di-GMP-binding flagellar brake protein YcgR